MSEKYSALKKLYKRVKGNHQKALFLAIGIATLTVLASSSLMAFSAFIISYSALQPSIAEILVPVTAVRFMGLLRAVLRYVERLVSHNTIFHYLSRLRVKIYQGISQMTGEQLFRLNKSDTLNVLTSDIETLQDVFLRGLLPLFSSLLLYGVVCVALMQFNVKIAMVFVVLYPVATFGMAIVAKRLSKGKSKKQMEALGDYKVKFTAFTDELAELNWNRRTLEFIRALEERAKELEKATAQISLGKIMASHGQQMVINLSVFLALMTGILLVKNNEMSGLYLAVCTLAMFTFYESAPAFLTLFQKLEAGEYSAKRLLEPITDESHPFKMPENRSLEDTNAPTIDYRGLKFQYEGSNVQLNDVTLQLTPKIKMAIVGASGSGKSTVSALLCGLLAPHGGTIDLNGSTVASNDSERLMSYFSVVNQEVFLFHQRLIDNLRIADSEVSNDAMEEALRFSGLSEWIDSGWFATNPWIGEDGVKLSGGQRQRLGLARALLRKAPYLILDEAFAGLDIETESEILERLLALEDRGLIWITHRLVQMSRMDHIVVMAEGKIIASGKHAYLIQNCEAYRSAL